MILHDESPWRSWIFHDKKMNGFVVKLCKGKAHIGWFSFDKENIFEEQSLPFDTFLNAEQLPEIKEIIGELLLRQIKSCITEFKSRATCDSAGVESEFQLGYEIDFLKEPKPLLSSGFGVGNDLPRLPKIGKFKSVLEIKEFFTELYPGAIISIVSEPELQIDIQIEKESTKIPIRSSVASQCYWAEIELQ